MLKDVITGPPKVSIIMPMYKCESFVDEALAMVCGQTLKEIEIICVLDGPDNAIKEKVEARAKEDPRITCLVEEHRGAGPARNAGLEIAKGKYLLFLDSDDLFKPNMVERLYTEAEKYSAEIVICSYEQSDAFTKMTSKELGLDFSKYPENTVIDCTVMDGLFNSFIGATWNKLLQREYIIREKLEFMDTRSSNDEFFITAAMTGAKRLVAIKEDLLTVRRHVNPDSITTNRAKSTEDVITVMNQIYGWLKQRGYWSKREEDYYDKFAEMLRYNSEFAYNEKFVEAAAQTLSRNMPWKKMSNVKMTQALNMKIPVLEAIRDTRADEIHALKNAVDVSGREYLLERTENRIKTIRAIRSLMKKKYGRDLSKRDNPIAWLSWSVGYRGWKGTLRRIKENIEGKKDLLLRNVVCSGYITAAGHYLTFFVPAETYREKATISNLKVAVRCNGYYPFVVSGEEGSVITPLGPTNTSIVNGGVPTRHEEIMRVFTDVSPGTGVFVQVRFKEELLRNRKREKADNNFPVSVHAEGIIVLE